MNNESGKIKSFEDLDAWRESHKFAIMIYKSTRKFPQQEQFGLTAQLRRAAVSITSNIAEGFSRNSYKEKSQFYSVALGSLTEVHNQLILAKDVGYITEDEFNQSKQQAIRANKIINGLIKKTRSFYS